MTTLPPPPQSAAKQILAELTADPDLAAEFWKLIADQKVKALPQTVAELDNYIRETLSQVAAQQAQTEKALAELTLKQEGTRKLLDEFIAEQRSANAEYRADINAIQDNLAQLNGADAERHAENNIAGLLRHHDPSLREIRILKSNHRGSDEATDDAIADAAEAGRISPEEHNQLAALDLLVRARPRRQEQSLYYAIEISRTLYPNDFTRAKERAQILAKALEVPTQALVIGHQIDEPNQARAAAMNVPCILYSRWN